MFVNAGTISAASLVFKSSYFQDNGTLVSGGPYNLTATLANLEKGQSSAGGDAYINCANLKLNGYQAERWRLPSSHRSDLDWGGRRGRFRGNPITVQSGLSFASPLPLQSSLLGTTLQLAPAQFIEADYMARCGPWSGGGLVHQ